MGQRVQPGDVLAIPLGDGRFAFGKVFKDTSLGVYDYIAFEKDALPSLDTPFAFIVGVFPDLLKSGEWPRVFRHPFSNEEDAWPPPYVVRDVISGSTSIYHKGAMRPASENDCKHLEPAAVWDKHHILDRIESLYRKN